MSSMSRNVFSSWCKRPTSPRTPPPGGGRPRPGRLEVERLEERTLLSANNAGTVQALDPAGAAVAAAVRYNAATGTATLTPNSPLGYSTAYTVLVHGGASGPVVKDTLGAALAADFTTTPGPTQSFPNNLNPPPLPPPPARWSRFRPWASCSRRWPTSSRARRSSSTPGLTT
jgi:hypothetical protein